MLLQVGYHSAAAKSIEIVVCMGEDSWAQQALAFKLLVMGSVDVEQTDGGGQGLGDVLDYGGACMLAGLQFFFSSAS